MFAQLGLARIIEPASKLGSARVLEEPEISLPRRHPLTAEFVISACHRLFEIEEVLPDVQARPAGQARLPPPARLQKPT